MDVTRLVVEHQSLHVVATALEKFEAVSSIEDVDPLVTMVVLQSQLATPDATKDATMVAITDVV